MPITPDRVGMTQVDRVTPALSPDYVSVEERTLLEHLHFIRAYAKKLRFYDKQSEQSIAGSSLTEAKFWTGFLDFSDAQLLEIASYAKDPRVFDNQPQKQQRYNKPHYVLLLTFLQLLQYPGRSFARLTAKHLEYFYQQCLQIQRRAEVADSAHLVVTLADNVPQYALPAGTLFTGIKDDSGVDVRFQLNQDIVLNQAQLADVRVVQFAQNVTNLLTLHESFSRGNAGFEAILKVALGGVAQLPDYIDTYGQRYSVDAHFLGQTLAVRIRDRAAEDISSADRHYINDSLGFRAIADCVYCLDLLYREQNRGYRGVVRVQDSDWDKAYIILANLHRENIARTRRKEVRDLHRSLGVLGMFEWLFGEPRPGHTLFAMPNKDNELSTLFRSDSSAAYAYIEEKLCLSVADFKSVYARVENQPGAISWEEVYTLLERAWTKKRQFKYPAVEQVEIKGIASRSLYDASGDFTTFTPFAEQAVAAGSSIDLGLLFSSWLLSMQEGQRRVDVFLQCKDASLPTADLQALLNIETETGIQPLIKAQFSTASGWQAASQVQSEVGDFIYGAPLTTFKTDEIQLIGVLPGTLPQLDNTLEGQYLLLSGGNSYRIAAIDSQSREFTLVSGGFSAATEHNRLIRQFTPTDAQQSVAGTLSFNSDTGLLTSSAETFNEFNEGMLLSDAQGVIYALQSFVSAQAMTASVLAVLNSEQQADAQWLNQIWLHLAPEYDPGFDLSSFIFTGARANRLDFSFAVSADTISLGFPENSSSEEILAAWEVWQRQSHHDAGRFQLKAAGESTILTHLQGELQSNNLVMKRYQSPVRYGLRVRHYGRQNITPSLTIKPPSDSSQLQATFVVAGNELIVTLGLQVFTSNQLAAQWSLSEYNQNSAFTLDATDKRYWSVPTLTDAAMLQQDKQVKFADITDSSDNGLRVTYTGATASSASVVLQENQIDKFDFSISPEHQLTVGYPSHTPTLAGSLVAAWQQWSADALNDTAGFTIELLGQDVYSLIGVAIYPLDQGDELEGTKSTIIDDNGFQVIYTRALHPDNKANARVLLLENDVQAPSDASLQPFEFSLNNDELNDTAELLVFYPPTIAHRTVENLLACWANWDATEHGETENNVYPSFTLSAVGKATWEISGQTRRELVATNDEFYELSTSGKPALHFEYHSNQGGRPTISTQAADIDAFEILISQVDGVAQSLLIRHPQDPSLGTVSGFYQAWLQLDDSAGFTVSDDSATVLPRMQAPLLATGNLIKTRSHSGLEIEYTGPDQDVFIDMQMLEAFNDDHKGQALLWDNGKVFNILERLDPHQLALEAGPQLNLSVPLGIYQHQQIHANAIHVQCQLTPDFPPVTALQVDEKDNLDLPSIKLTLNNDFARYPGSTNEEPLFLYALLRDVVIEQAGLYVDVTGLSALFANNNQDLVDTQNPFAPFASRPRKGAPFYFAHQEICGKPLDSLHVNFQWQPLLDPQTYVSHSIPDIGAYYTSYFQAGQDSIGDINAMDFRLALDFHQQNAWHSLPVTEDRLFAEHLYMSELQQQGFDAALFDTDTLNDNPLSWPMYYRLTLRQGMLNDEYTRVERRIAVASQQAAVARAAYDSALFNIEHHRATVKATEVAAAVARTEGLDYYPPAIPEPGAIPNIRATEQELAQLDPPLPYTPQLNGLSVSYRASAHISLLDQNLVSRQPKLQLPLNLYRYHPFGVRPMGLEADKDDYFLPYYDKQGYLYIGLSQCLPGQMVSVLFQLLSGSGANHINAPEVEWRYLASHQWQPFPLNRIVKDSTSGLRDSGLIQFLLPDDLSLAHTLMPAGKGWLRAEFVNNLSALPDIANIKTQAIEVQYQDLNNDPLRLSKPLPANSLNTLEQPVADVIEVSQPYTSFGGQLSEDSLRFNQRISELLHNKGRSLTFRDYESALLSAYPQLQKVKCIAASSIPIGSISFANDQQASATDLIIIAVMKNQDSLPFLPARPTLPVALLARMQASIDSIKPATVKVRVQNPQFEEITFRLAVKFRPGREKGFYSNALNQAITRFLSPWAYQEEVEISVGNTIYSAAVINFIEGLEYVDYIARFTLLRQVIHHKTHDEVLPLFLTQTHGATAKYPDAVLVAADEHVIDVIDDNLYDAAAFKGIGHMQIGSDFWIARPRAIFDVGIGRMEIDELQIPKTLFTSIDGVSAALSADLWQRMADNAYLDIQGNLLPAFNPDTGLNGFILNGTITPATLDQLGLDTDILWTSLLAQNVISRAGEVLLSGSQIVNDELALPLAQFEQLQSLLDAHFSIDYDIYRQAVYALVLQRLDYQASQYPYIVY